jgi:hypothetical protein
MPRAKNQTEATTNTLVAGDVFDQAIAAQQAPAAPETVQQPSPPDAADHAAHAAPKKKWTPPADPFGFENQRGEGNRVRLLKSEGMGAWVIRFEKNPNEMQGYSKVNPHPVLKMLKEEGYRWGFDDGDGKGGWGKPFSGDPYGADHLEARRVLEKAAEMIGAAKEQGAQVG